jgi:LPS export ABC transporter protein LptC
MKNITKNNKILKYIFLISGIIVLFLIISYSSNKEQQIPKDELDTEKMEHIPKEFNLNINNSVFEGYNKDKLPYQIKAKMVTKANNTIYNLNDINAQCNTGNGVLQILAQNGVLNETTKFFTIYQNVQIIFDNISLTSDKINFNLNSNLVYSDQPVIVNFQNSTIKASSFSADDSNNIINFKGNVVSTFNLNDF